MALPERSSAGITMSASSADRRPFCGREELRGVRACRRGLRRLLRDLRLRREQALGRRARIPATRSRRRAAAARAASRSPISLTGSPSCARPRCARPCASRARGSSRCSSCAALLTNGPPSATNTFFASCAWHHAFSTDVRGLAPMRVVPTSWMISPPIEMPSSACRVRGAACGCARRPCRPSRR